MNRFLEFLLYSSMVILITLGITWFLAWIVGKYPYLWTFLVSLFLLLSTLLGVIFSAGYFRGVV